MNALAQGFIKNFDAFNKKELNRSATVQIDMPTFNNAGHVYMLISTEKPEPAQFTGQRWPEPIEETKQTEEDEKRQPGWYWIRMIDNGPWRPACWYHSSDGEIMWTGLTISGRPAEIGNRIKEPKQ